MVVVAVAALLREDYRGTFVVGGGGLRGSEGESNFPSQIKRPLPLYQELRFSTRNQLVAYAHGVHEI